MESAEAINTLLKEQTFQFEMHTRNWDNGGYIVSWRFCGAWEETCSEIPPAGFCVSLVHRAFAVTPLHPPQPFATVEENDVLQICNLSLHHTS